MNYTGKRHLATWGGLLAGLGLGSCLTWWLNIFEIANPKTSETSTSNSGGWHVASLYPSMALTVFLVLVFSGAFGLGLGLVASALIRNDDVPHARTASVTDPEGVASPQTT